MRVFFLDSSGSVPLLKSRLLSVSLKDATECSDCSACSHAFFRSFLRIFPPDIFEFVAAERFRSEPFLVRGQVSAPPGGLAAGAAVHGGGLSQGGGQEAQSELTVSLSTVVSRWWCWWSWCRSLFRSQQIWLFLHDSSIAVAASAAGRALLATIASLLRSFRRDLVFFAPNFGRDLDFLLLSCLPVKNFEHPRPPSRS